MSSGAESNGSARQRANGSPKVDGRMSPRSCSPLTEKKRAGTKVAELETKLGRVQDELKKLQEQLASAEAAKADAQVALEAAKKRVGVNSPGQRVVNVCIEKTKDPLADDDVSGITVLADDDGDWTCQEVLEEKMVEDAAVAELKVKLSEMEKAIEMAKSENAELKKIAEDAERAVIVKQEEAAARMSKLEDELNESRGNEGRLEEKLKAAIAEKVALEAEMRRLRVQMAQWRKAAEAAAAVLERGSPVDDEGEGVRRKWQVAGVRIISDLLRKKGQQK